MRGAVGAAAFAAEVRKHAAIMMLPSARNWNGLASHWLLKHMATGAERFSAHFSDHTLFACHRPGHAQLYSENGCRDLYGHLNLSPVRSVASAIIGRELASAFVELYKNCSVDLRYTGICVVLV